MTTFALDTTVDAMNMTRDKYGYSGSVIPSEWKTITLSLGCGERVIVWHWNDLAMMVRGSKMFGVETFLKNGEYTRIHRGSGKTAEAVRSLCDRFLIHGVRGALRDYAIATVRCCCCGAELTDPNSRQMAIGPKCIRTIHGAAIARLFGLL